MASTNVAVAVRCRPLSSKETQRGCGSVVKVDKGAAQISVTGAREGNGSAQTFTYDHAYGPEADQAQIYGDIGAPLVAKAFDGFNGTIFAYGQTGSGKTHTMMGVLGDKDLRGVVPRLADDLFDHATASIDEAAGGEAGASKRVQVTVSYLEIYNEVLHDLLNPQAESNLKIRENPEAGIYVEKLCELVVSNSADVFRLLEQGNRMRKVASTSMNERSSRSHSVFTLTVAQKLTQKMDNGNERETALQSKLNLVDLAGSERASKTGAQGSTLKEGAAINQSLMALGGVINALSEGAAFVPYRNSKLTRLLQESLGGNAATVMVANVSPADYNAEETVGTLRYASRAKTIKNVVTRNEDVHERVIRELQEEIERLRSQLGSDETRHELSPRKERELQSKMEEQRQHEAELEAKLRQVEQAKEDEWHKREELSRQLEEERKNNLNRQLADVMSSVKDEKLRLLNQVKELQERKATRLKVWTAGKDEYKKSKAALEQLMRDYERAQTAHDNLDPNDPAYERAGDELLRMLGAVEQLRAKLLAVRSKVNEEKDAVQALDLELAASKAELSAAASTMAENQRLRAAIQEEERQAFQSQRDAYLQAQLAEERQKLDAEKAELAQLASDANGVASTAAAELTAATRRVELLEQEVALLKEEKQHMDEQLESAGHDLDHALDEKRKLENDLAESEDRLNTVEYDVEAEREKAEALREELWRLKHASERDARHLRDQLRAVQLQLDSKNLSSQVEKKSQRLSMKKNKSNADLPGTQDPLAAVAGPLIAEAKDQRAGASDDKKVAASAVAELHAQLSSVESDRDRLANLLSDAKADAKENEYKIFKSLMDAANSDRAESQAQVDNLRSLLQQSLHDILYLQKQNDQYKRELDLRRSLDPDEDD